VIPRLKEILGCFTAGILLKDAGFDRVRRKSDLAHAANENGSVFRETQIPRFAVGARILWRTRVAGAKGGPTGLQGGQPTYMRRIQDTACMEPMASEIRSRSRLSTPTEGCLGANEGS
jgi:hypothetical protein